MFSNWRKSGRKHGKISRMKTAILAGLEPLESRQMLSASPAHFGGGFGGGFDGGFGGGPGGVSGRGNGGRQEQTIAFSLAPTAVKTGLDNLASTDKLTAPTATQLVDLNNVNGVETYSITIDGTGTVTRLTVDQLGDAVTAPTHTTTTWATLDGTGTGSDSAAATEILAIATAQSLTAPTSTTVVNVSTTSTGAVTYSVNLTASSSTSTTTTTDDSHDFGIPVTVDAAGNPVGNQKLPFSVFSTTIQDALNTNAPTGATALAATATDPVSVRTTDGITTYSVTFTVTGTQTTVTVNSTGKLTNLPTTTTTTFSTLTSSVQTELQTLATADGVTTTIASTQSVDVLTETTGTIIYSVTLAATGTDSSGSTYTFNVTVSSDASGNPTTLPHDQGGVGGGAGGGFGFAGNGGDCSGMGSGTNSSGGSTSNSSSGSTSNSSTAAIALPDSGDATATSLTASTVSSSSYSITGKLLADGEFALASVGTYILQFAPLKADTAVLADLIAIGTELKQLGTDTKALTAAQKKTLATDEKAIATALKSPALKATLSPLVSTLKSDATTWGKTLHADRAAIIKDRKNATALAAAKTQLATDQASAFAAICKDVTAITDAIDSNTAVSTAKDQLATDLPTIGSDIATLSADQSQLISDL